MFWGRLSAVAGLGASSGTVCANTAVEAVARAAHVIQKVRTLKVIPNFIPLTPVSAGLLCQSPAE
jgi:hypothetical protein